MQISLKKDGKGYLAEVRGVSGVFAWGKTKKIALQELAYVIEAMIDCHLEEVEKGRHLRDIVMKKVQYAV